MTPAILLLEKHGIAHQVHEFGHSKSAQPYGIEAATKLGVEPALVFKTLVVSLDGSLGAVALLPVDKKLDMKQLAKLYAARKASLAEAAAVIRHTGYLPGGVSPLAQKKHLPTVIDNGASQLPIIYISAGKRGVDISLAPQDLATLTDAAFHRLCKA